MELTMSINPNKLVFTTFEKRETLKVRLAKSEYRHLLSYFGQEEQLRLPTGTAYYQGNGWYEIHLNTDTFRFDIAVRRFTECLRVAFGDYDQIIRHKQRVTEYVAAIAAATKGVRHYSVVYRPDHRGRPTAVVLNRTAQAILNKDAEIIQDILRVTPASADRLQSLESLFSQRRQPNRQSTSGVQH